MSQLPYRLAQWCGITQYKCCYCPYDTVEGEEAILMHYAAEHLARPAELRPGLVFVADKTGREVSAPAPQLEPERTEANTVEIDLTPEQVVASKQPLAQTKPRKRKED